MQVIAATRPRVAPIVFDGSMSVTAHGKRLGRPPRSENQRALILASAARLFATKGYENCTIAEVAQAMNISKAAVYHYFRTKREIYEEIIVVTLRSLSEYVDQAVGEKAAASEQLKTFMTAHARFFETHYWGFTSMLAALGGIASPATHDDVIEIRDRHEQRLRSVIAKGIDSGEFRVTDTETTARAVLSMLNWMVRWFRPGGPKCAEEFANDYYRLVFDGIKNRDPGSQE